MNLRKACELFDFSAWVNEKLSGRPGGDYEGNELRINCWRCGDQRGRLYVNVAKRRWKCFNEDCFATYGGMVRFVAEVEGIQPWQVAKRLRDEATAFKPGDAIALEDRLRTAFTMDHATRPDRPVVASRLPKGTVPLDHSSRAANQARTYLSRRGVLLDELPPGVWATTFHPNTGTATFHGWLIWEPLPGVWQARRLGKGEPRYLNSPTLHRHLGVIGEETDGPLLVVEGIFKALGLRRIVPWATRVTFGKSCSEQQRAQLIQEKRPVVLAWDRDALGLALKLADDLNGLVPSVSLWIARFDPDDVLESEEAKHDFSNAGLVHTDESAFLSLKLRAAL